MIIYYGTKLSIPLNAHALAKYRKDHVPPN